MSVTPQARAATTTAGSARPSAFGGVQMTRTGQAASAAGTASMMAVEGKGALPAGTYKPTACSGRLTRSQTTPGAVSTRIGSVNWASWKRRTLPIAVAIAALAAGDKAASASNASASDTLSA